MKTGRGRGYIKAVLRSVVIVHWERPDGVANVMPAQAGIQDVNLDQRQVALDSRVKHGNEKGLAFPLSQSLS